MELKELKDKFEQPMYQNELKETVISPDAEFKGSLKFKDSLRIDGSFEGEIDSQGTLFVGRPGLVKAEIHVGNIIVEGKIEGNIICDDKIDLRSTAKIFGDIQAVRLTIAEGVNIVGKCSVSTEKQSYDTYNQETENISVHVPSVSFPITQKGKLLKKRTPISF